MRDSIERSKEEGRRQASAEKARAEQAAIEAARSKPRRLPKPFTCPSRGRLNLLSGPPGEDRWMKYSNGDRVCSCCTSIHPDDFWRFIEAASNESSEVCIEPADARFQTLIHRSDVKYFTAFYAWHLNAPFTDDQNVVYRVALIHSSNRLYGALTKHFVKGR